MVINKKKDKKNKYVILDEFTRETYVRKGYDKALKTATNVQGVIFLNGAFIKDCSC